MSITNIKTYDDLLLEAKEAKYAQIWAECDKRTSQAENVFNTSNHISPFRNADRLNRRHSKLSNKQHRNIPLSPEEEFFSDSHEDMMDWQDSTDNVAEDTEDFIELVTDINTVNEYDVVNDPSWLSPFTL